MPTALFPRDAIPKLAEQANAPQVLKVLRRIQQAGFIVNSRDIDQQTAATLRQLSDLGLVDAGYDEPPVIQGEPFQWVSNANGSAVLSYLASIPVGPHYEILSAELAAWLEEQGEQPWWNVDGDPLLTERMTFPCPGSELAAEIRKINRPLLVQAKRQDTGAKGQPVTKDKLNELVGRFAENLKALDTAEEMPPWGQDRLLYMRWKGEADDWLLAEDNETSEQMREERNVQSGASAKTKPG